MIKDVTSILGMSRDRRNEVLGALREIYDGRWDRDVGTAGGFTLTWTGRLVVVGAVTTAWDTAHGAIAKLGDRFALVRVDSTRGRNASGKQALRNVGDEPLMRAELVTALGGLLRAVQPALATLTDEDEDDLLAAADLVTYVRTAVERDYRGEVIDAHAPEAPTRFAKMLGQMARGGLALGMPREKAMKLALRIARDSMPPLRLRLLVDVMGNPGTTTTETTKRVQKPRTTVDRALQELHLLGLLAVEGGGDADAVFGKGKAWCYSLTDLVDPEVLAKLYHQKWLPASSRGSEERAGQSTEQAETEPAEQGPQEGSAISGDGLWPPGQAYREPAGIRCSECRRLLPPSYRDGGWTLCPSCEPIEEYA